jgi:hypothetical protein
MTTLTAAEVGTEIATDGVIDSIVMTKAPTDYGQDYFCLTDDERVLFNMHVQTSPISTGSNLISGGSISFAKLVLKSLPIGSEFEIELVTTAPTLSSLTPSEAEAGSAAELVLQCQGSNFTGGSVIVFGDYDEPTTFVSDTELTTIVKPALFVNPDTVPVKVRTGALVSDPVDFTFIAPVVPPVEEAPEAAPERPEQRPQVQPPPYRRRR